MRSVRGRRLVPVLLATGVFVGAASAVGAQVDLADPAARTVWSASCVSTPSGELVVYGRGWASAPVDLEVIDQAGTSVGRGSALAAAGAFQGRVGLGAAPASTALRVTATQAGGSATYEVTVRPTCTPTVNAVVTGTLCGAAGQPMALDVSVRGLPANTFDRLVHAADLAGPAESISRVQPARPNGDYVISLTVANVPDRTVPVTVQARRTAGGALVYATTNVTLPPVCTTGTGVTTTVPRGSATTVPKTVPTTAGPAPGGVTTLPPSLAPFPGTASGTAPGPPSLSLSPTLGQAGQAATVAGRGFAPSATLVLRWSVGIGEWTVRAGGDGSFRTQVLVLPNDVEGPRSLVVEDDTPTASYLVVPGTERPAFGGVFLRS